MNGRPWTRDDLRWLRRFRRDGVPVEDMADVLDRSVSSIRCKLVAAKIHGGRQFWSPADDAVMRRDYKRVPTTELMARLGRTRLSIHQHANKLGLNARVPRLTQEFFDQLCQLNASGKTDSEIAATVGKTRTEISRIRRRLKVPACEAGIREAKRLAVQHQRETLGIRTAGQLRSLSFRRFAERRGWPPETRPREVQILELLAVAGPLTKAQISERIGVPPKPRKNGRGFLYLCGNNRGSYTASLVAAGLVIRLPRAHQVAGKGRGHSCDLYMLSPAAMDIVINRVHVQENQNHGKAKQ